MNVQLVIYDLSRGLATSLSQSFLGIQINGIWHTGVVVFDKEIYYGGGIQVSSLGQFSNSNNLYPIEVVSIGITSKTKDELDVFLSSIYSRFTASTYDLLRNNCNHFSNEVCLFLTGKTIPSYIVDLPNIVRSSPGGQMLLPMIDNMQQMTLQQTSNTFDPFGNHIREQSSNIEYSSSVASTNSTTTFESNLSSIIQETITNSTNSTNGTTITVPVFKKAKLEERPLVSNDKSSIGALGKKLLQLQDSNGNVLSESYQQLVQEVIDSLQSNSMTLSLGRLHNVYEMFLQFLQQYPTLMMTSLFFVRLLVLQSDIINWDDLSKASLSKLISWILNNLSDKNSYLQSNIPALTMGLCTLSNTLSHSHGCSFLFTYTYEFEQQLLDVIVSYLSHTRLEVRQMASALGYNYILYYTSKISSSNSTNDDNSLSPTILQLYLAAMEDISQEHDEVVRMRRLSLICQIIRSSEKQQAISLGNDLGFIEQLKNLSKLVKHDNEKQVILELLYSFTH